jgi:hypothetical protein
VSRGDAADWILIRVRPFVDAALRRRHLAQLLTHAPSEAATSAAALVARAIAGTTDPEVGGAVTALILAMGDLDYPARATLYRAAIDAGAPSVARLLLDASPPTVNPADLDRQLRPERPLRNRGRPLTLGERKALARRPRGDALTALLRDPHPDVVRILLDNPQLTEREAIAIAASRPAVPAALALVAEHPRWSARSIVRRALALNPHTPVHVAIRLAVTLGPADWIEIASAGDLSPALRDHARELLDARRRL